MPTYDYVCSGCGHRLEVVHGIHGHGPRSCPSCGAEGTMVKAFVPPAIHFKGSGWAKKDRAATATPGKAGTKSADTPGTSASADASSGGGEGGTPSTTSGPGERGPASTTSGPGGGPARTSGSGGASAADKR